MRGLCPRAPGIYRFRARMAPHWGGVAAPVIPAAESALEFHPWRALSSAQVIAIITPGIWSIQGICAQALTTGLRTALYSHSDWYKIPVRPVKSLHDACKVEKALGKCLLLVVYSNAATPVRMISSISIP